jgi:hypothetical protein
VHVGDRLRLLLADGTAVPAVVCRGVSIIRKADRLPGDPAHVGLLVPELSKQDVAPGDCMAGDLSGTTVRAKDADPRPGGSAFDRSVQRRLDRIWIRLDNVNGLEALGERTHIFIGDADGG